MVFTDIGREHLHELRVVVCRTSRDALKGIDAAEADIEGRASELIDGPGEALGDLAGLIEAVTPGGARSVVLQALSAEFVAPVRVIGADCR
jgi:hypothetical protein